MTMNIGRYNQMIFVLMLLGTLGGVAGIVLIVLGQSMAGGIMTLSWIPAAIGCLEWRCRERQSLNVKRMVKRDPKTIEAFPVDVEVRINIAPNSPGSK
jgi:hypothetical protein